MAVAIFQFLLIKVITVTIIIHPKTSLSGKYGLAKADLPLFSFTQRAKCLSTYWIYCHLNRLSLVTRLNNLLNNRHKSAFMLWQFLFLHSAAVGWKSSSQGSKSWWQVCRQQLKTLPSQWPGMPLQSASYRIETTLAPNIYFSLSSNFNPEIMEPGSHLEKQ